VNNRKNDTFEVLLRCFMKIAGLSQVALDAELDLRGSRSVHRLLHGSLSQMDRLPGVIRCLGKHSAFHSQQDVHRLMRILQEETFRRLSKKRQQELTDIVAQVNAVCDDIKFPAQDPVKVYLIDKNKQALIIAKELNKYALDQMRLDMTSSVHWIEVWRMSGDLLEMLS